jgi:uncharacterized protein
VGNSLRDQLLQSGLATQKQAKNAEAQKNQQRKQARKADKHKVLTPEAEEARQIAEMYRAEKAARDRELNRQREEERQRKALQAQARDLIGANEVAREAGELPFNFKHGSKIKRIHVSATQHKQLAGGSLGIATLKGTYRLLPAATAKKLQTLGSNALIHLGAPPADEADAYEDHPIPDDLMW